MAETQMYMPKKDEFEQRLRSRHRRGRIGQAFYYVAVGISIVALLILFVTVVNEAFGTIAIETRIDPLTLTDGRPLAELSSEELVNIVEEHAKGGLRVVIRDNLSAVPNEVFVTSPIEDVLAGRNVPATMAEQTINQLTPDDWKTILTLNFSRDELQELVERDIVGLSVVGSWPLFDTIFNYAKIQAEAEAFPNATLQFNSWITRDFIVSPMSSVPADSGIRTALLGSVYMMVIVVLVSLPIGVGAAVYLEEYASDTWLNRFIETNVRNLAGVPSIIYGMLGLAIVVRAISIGPFTFNSGVITSGVLFGYNLPENKETAIVLTVANAVGFENIAPEAWEDLANRTTTIEFGTALGSLPPAAQKIVVNSLSADTLERINSEVPNASFEGSGNPPATTEKQLTATETRRLTDIYASYRTPSVSWLFSRGPTDEDFRNSILSVVSVGRLGEPAIQALSSSLKNYANIVINGRTIISAALTLALLVLPIVIISSQEALRAVPWTIREASFGLGATQWQTIWRQVLPAALPGILTGTILAVARAIGETAPLIVVGASTFIDFDPTGPFSKFTALPIQIYNWTSRPQDQFRDIAAAAIIVLLVLMLTLNSLAIILRNRFAIKY